MLKNGKRFASSILKNLVIVLFMSTFLSACGLGAADMEVKIYAGNKFDFKMTWLIPVDSFLTHGVTQEVEAALDEMVAEARNENDIKMTWKSIKTGDPKIVGYELLVPKTKISDEWNDIFTMTKVTYNNRKADCIDFSGVADFRYSFSSFTLTLHGGKILETNGKQVNSNTVTWVNPGQTPYAIMAPKSSLWWIPLVLGIMALGVLVLVMSILLVTGKVKAWGAAAINSGKWKIEESKLAGQKKNIIQEKEALISELAKKAWEARVLHHSYTEPYFELETLDGKRVSLAEENARLTEELQQVRESYGKVVKEYSQQTNDMQSEQKVVAKKLNQSKIRQLDLEKELMNALQHQEKAKDEIAGYHKKLSQVQSSDLPDKEARMNALKNAIISLEGSLEKISIRIPQIEMEISQIKTDQEPFTDQFERLNGQISEVQRERKEALAPLEQQVNNLEQSLKSNAAEINVIQQKMTPLIESLGPLVETARPYSGELADLYQQIDALNANLASVTQDHGLMSSRLEAIDKGAVRSFSIMTVGVVLMSLLILILFVLVFVLG
ncbi:MAG: hypothetical protein WCY93_00755 [Anaerolineaceae bacterium]